MQSSGTIMVVLSDGETWAGDGFVRILKGDYPDGDADHVDKNEIVLDIPIGNLLECYNKVHNTDY